MNEILEKLKNLKMVWEERVIDREELLDQFPEFSDEFEVFSDTVKEIMDDLEEIIFDYS